MNKQDLLSEIDKVCEHLRLLYDLENKKVAFYNREVYEYEMKLYVLKQDLLKLENEVSK